MAQDNDNGSLIGPPYSSSIGGRIPRYSRSSTSGCGSNGLLGVGTGTVVANVDARNEGLRTSRLRPETFYGSQRRETHGRRRDYVWDNDSDDDCSIQFCQEQQKVYLHLSQLSIK